MADRYWVNDDSDGDFSNANNWSATDGGAGGAGVPGSGDTARFESTVNDDCTLSADVTTGPSLRIFGGYSGTIDLNDYALTVQNVTVSANSCTWKTGTGTFTINGTMTVAWNVGTMTKEGGKLVIAGTSKSVDFLDTYGNIEVTGTTIYCGRMVADDLTIKTGASIEITSSSSRCKDLYVESSATMTITTNTMEVGSGRNLKQQDGTINGTGTLRFYNWGGTLPWVSGITQFDVAIQLYSFNQTKDLTLESGTITFDKGLKFLIGPSGSITVNNDTNDPVVYIGGDFAHDPVSTGGTLTWNKGVGNVIFSGNAGTFAVNLDGQDFEDTQFNQAGATWQLANDAEFVRLRILAGTVKMGSGSIETGDLDCSGGALEMESVSLTVNGGYQVGSLSSLDAGTSSVDLAGTSEAIYTTAATWDFYDLTVSGSYDTSGVGRNLNCKNSITVTGTLDLDNVNSTLIATSTLASFTLTGGTVTGLGTISWGTASGTFPTDGTISCSQVTWTRGTTLPARTFDADLMLRVNQISTVTFGAGTLTVNGDLANTDNTSNLAVTYDFDTNDPTVNVSGDLLFNTAIGTQTVEAGAAVFNVEGSVDVSTVSTYTGGSETWNLAGAASGTQTIESNGKSLGAFVVNDSGAIKQLVDDLNCASFQLDDGDLDLNSKTLTTSGNFAVNSAADVSDWGGGTIDVGGNFGANGTGIGSELVIAAATTWTLNVTGGATAQYVDVQNSDASGGTEVIAADSLDSGGNVNWDFGTERTVTIAEVGARNVHAPRLRLQRNGRLYG